MIFEDSLLSTVTFVHHQPSLFDLTLLQGRGYIQPFNKR